MGKETTPSKRIPSNSCVGSCLFPSLPHKHCAYRQVGRASLAAPAFAHQSIRPTPTKTPSLPGRFGSRLGPSRHATAAARGPHLLAVVQQRKQQQGQGQGQVPKERPCCHPSTTARLPAV